MGKTGLSSWVLACCRAARSLRSVLACDNHTRDGESPVIEARGLAKRYGATLAVNDLSFTVRPGLVTGFLGPNGAGKTTAMRLILGLDYPTAGAVTVNGHRYAELASPMREVGALLDARRCTAAAAPAVTCAAWPRPTALPSAGWTRCWAP